MGNERARHDAQWHSGRELPSFGHRKKREAPGRGHVTRDPVSRARPRGGARRGKAAGRPAPLRRRRRRWPLPSSPRRPFDRRSSWASSSIVGRLRSSSVGLRLSVARRSSPAVAFAVVGVVRPSIVRPSSPVIAILALDDVHRGLGASPCPGTCEFAIGAYRRSIGDASLPGPVPALLRSPWLEATSGPDRPAATR